jgi:hypothetical protein
MMSENVQPHHIAAAMKVDLKTIWLLADHPRLAFHLPQMRPVNGKMRLITVPKRKWMVPYEWLSSFARNELPLHSAAHGSVPSRSPFTMARHHIGIKDILSRDVKNAFPSVESDRFYLQLLALGFESETARLLTKLLLPDGYIPQGGPASNAAMDLYFYRVDSALERKLSVLGGTYTRFTDNLDVSFSNPENATQIGDILDSELRRIGLTINQKKSEQCGYQPRGQEQVLCGVRVDSPRGTKLPRKLLARISAGCESLSRGATTIAPHTLPGLAKRRRSLQGLLNQASQADIAPRKSIQRQLRQVDFVVLHTLSRNGVFPKREWYTKGEWFNTPLEISRAWAVRRLLAPAKIRWPGSASVHATVA